MHSTKLSLETHESFCIFLKKSERKWCHFSSSTVHLTDGGMKRSIVHVVFFCSNLFFCDRNKLNFYACKIYQLIIQIKKHHVCEIITCIITLSVYLFKNYICFFTLEDYINHNKFNVWLQWSEELIQPPTRARTHQPADETNKPWRHKPT